MKYNGIHFFFSDEHTMLNIIPAWMPKTKSIFFFLIGFIPTVFIVMVNKKSIKKKSDHPGSSSTLKMTWKAFNKGTTSCVLPEIHRIIHYIC